MLRAKNAVRAAIDAADTIDAATGAAYAETNEIADAATGAVKAAVDAVGATIDAVSTRTIIAVDTAITFTNMTIVAAKNVANMADTAAIAITADITKDIKEGTERDTGRDRATNAVIVAAKIVAKETANVATILREWILGMERR